MIFLFDASIRHEGALPCLQKYGIEPSPNNVITVNLTGRPNGLTRCRWMSSIATCSYIWRWCPRLVEKRECVKNTRSMCWRAVALLDTYQGTPEYIVHKCDKQSRAGTGEKMG